MIVSKKKQEQVDDEVLNTGAVEPTPTPPTLTPEQEASQINPLAEAYKAVRNILSQIHVDANNPDSPLLFKTIKMDTGQLARLKNNTHNLEYALACPAVLIHFVDVYYNIGQSRIGDGKGVMRIHYILNRLNNEDDEVELDGLYVYQRIVEAIEAHKNEFPALVSRFQLQYWDQPLSFDDGLQPYWIDYQIWFRDYTAYAYKDYVEKHMVIPPFTNHSDQDPSSNPDHHPDHETPTYEQVTGFLTPE